MKTVWILLESLATHNQRLSSAASVVDRKRRPYQSLLMFFFPPLILIFHSSGVFCNDHSSSRRFCARGWGRARGEGVKIPFNIAACNGWDLAFSLERQDARWVTD